MTSPDRAAPDMRPVDRYDLSLIAAIITHSPTPMAAAYKLYTEGYLRAPHLKAEP